MALNVAKISGHLVLEVGVFLTGFIFIVMALDLSVLGIGGRDGHLRIKSQR